MPYTIGPGVAQAMKDAGDEPRSNEEYHNAPGSGEVLYSLTQGRDAMYRWTPSDGVKRLPFADAAPTTRLLKAIDVSSNNGYDIGPLITRYTPDLVIVKAYQSIELGGKGGDYTIAHARTAQSKGCAVAFYVWLYAGVNGGDQVRYALATIAQTAMQPKSLILDCESYTDGSDPSAAVIGSAVGEVEHARLQPWIYTGAWWWNAHTMQGSTDFGQYPLWAAQYDGIPTLESVKPFGGWNTSTIKGKQYQGNPVDLSVISSELVE